MSSPARDTVDGRVDDIRRLHDISVRLFAATEWQAVLEEILDAAIALVNADFGTIQLCDAAGQSLQIVAHRGFKQEFLDYFDSVHQDASSCGAPMGRGDRFVVEDVLSDPSFQPHLPIVAAAGYRAFQSTPLRDHAGNLLGMISTHFRQRHRPSAREFQLLDLYALQAAETIERRQEEQALRASAQRFRSLVQDLPAAIYTCDVSGRITLFNDAARTLWGRAPELYRQQWCGSWRLYRPDGSPLALSESPMALTLKQGRTVIGDELIVERPDGTRRNVLQHPVLLRNSSGALIGGVNTLLDITDQRMSQQALHESQTRLQRCFELGLIGMAVTSTSKGILDVNDEMCRILGYERNELLQKTWLELTFPDDRQADMAQYERVLSGDIDGYRLDKRWIRKDGRIIDSIMAASCQRRADGSVDYFVGFVQDITERKRIENETGALKNELAVELTAMTRLHEFSTRLLRETELQHLLQEVLDTVVALHSANLGILQLYKPGTELLEIVASRGSATEFDEFMRVVAADAGKAGSRVLRDQQRVIIKDVTNGIEFGPYRDAAITAGVRSLQSTPLFSRTSRLLGIISTYFRQPHSPSDHVLRMTDLYARQAAEMIESKQSELALRRYQHELQELTTRLIETQEDQSKHLARELHDVFSQRLAGIGMELTRLADDQARSGQPAGAYALHKSSAEIRALASDIHVIARQIHPAILDDLGLSAAIRSECLACSTLYNMAAEFMSDDIPFWVPDDVALCLYRVAQESLRNIGQHAGTARVQVQLRAHPGELVLIIEDEGQGFSADSISGRRGLGLVSMEERLRIVGGAISIRSQTGVGTQVRASVPIAS